MCDVIEGLPSYYFNLGVPGVPAPKYVVYTTSTSSPSHLTAASIYASASMAAAPRPSHIPAHYSSYPGAAAASIHHSRYALCHMLIVGPTFGFYIFNIFKQCNKNRRNLRAYVI